MKWKIPCAMITVVWLCIAEIFFKTHLLEGYIVSYGVISLMGLTILAKATIAKSGRHWVECSISYDANELTASRKIIKGMVEWERETLLFDVATRRAVLDSSLSAEDISKRRKLWVRIPVAGIGGYSDRFGSYDVFAASRIKIIEALSKGNYVTAKCGRTRKEKIYKRIWIHLAIFCPFGHNIF